MMIAVTGTFGSGKSTVSQMLKEELKDADFLDADEIAKTMLDNPAIKKDVRNALGEAVFDRDKIDKKALARIIFSDDKKRKMLESIVHPAVRRYAVDFAAASKKKFVVYEVPLLFESRFEAADKIVVVKCEAAERKKRLMKKGFDEKTIQQRTLAQMTEEEKLKKANYVVDNSGPQESTKEQVKRVASAIKERK